jgi:hypothetical protein
MRRKYSRLVAIVTAALAGGLAAFALRPATGTSTATLAARNPAIEVRTQVIRRTIHVIRHEPGAALRATRGRGGIYVAGHGHARTAASGKHGTTHGAGASAAAVATRASGAHSSGSVNASSAAGAPVATRSSGSHGASSAPAAAQSHPVTTRSSGSHSGSSAPAASHPVTTRSSGSHSGSAGGSSSARPVTRSSGGGHGHGEDGGDGHGGDD